MTSDDVIISGVESIVLLGDVDVHLGVMAALFLACKQIWGHVRTCRTAVKMADLK